MTIALDTKKCEVSVLALSKTLANTYLLAIKTQNFHWNVVDGRFHMFHLFFEEQYTNLLEAVDEVAERIRMLGKKSPGSMREFLELSSLKETSENLETGEMLTELLYDHESIIKDLREEIVEAQKHGDEGTADLLIGRLRFHEKTAWMVRSHL